MNTGIHMANMFNRHLIGNFNFFLLIFAIAFTVVYLTVLELSIWGLMFKVPKKYKKTPFLKMISKDFINSIEDPDREKMMMVRRYLLIAFFLTILRFIVGVGNYFFHF